MTKEQVESFLSAIGEAGVTSYEYLTDMNSHLYNNDAAINIYDGDLEQVVNISRTLRTGTPQFFDNLVIDVANLNDIHEIRVGCNYEQAKTIIESYGYELTDDQLKIMLKINSSNKPIIPATGDYHNSDFHRISDETYANLSDEEKAKYDAKLAEENKRYDLPKGTAAMIIS